MRYRATWRDSLGTGMGVRLERLPLEHGVELGVVVHLHLLVDLHVLTPCGDILQELIDGCGEISLLLEEDL